jgi:hypothetical protein
VIITAEKAILNAGYGVISVEIDLFRDLTISVLTYSNTELLLYYSGYARKYASCQDHVWDLHQHSCTWFQTVHIQIPDRGPLAGGRVTMYLDLAHDVIRRSQSNYVWSIPFASIQWNLFS